MSERVEKFEELIVWQKAHQLMLDAYKFSEFLPSDEKFGRSIQLKRSSASIAANIAEGFGRYHYQTNIQFCRQARGSLEETANHLIAARDLNQAPKNICNDLLQKCDEVRIILNGYIKSLKESKRLNNSIT